MHENIVVVGAGPAGLAVGAMLRRRGLDPLLVDRADSVGSTWRHHYDRLHLHTARSLSQLPGLRMPRSYGRFVARADVVDYLERYASHHDLRLALGTPVERIERTETGWRLICADGAIDTTYVVVATGHNNTAVLPDWRGREGFSGELVHAASYRNPKPYVGRDVLVVGGGNTASEIAVDLVEGGARRVRLAVRTPPNIVRREVAGLPTQMVSVLVRHLPPALVDRMIRTVQRVTVPDLTRASAWPGRSTASTPASCGTTRSRSSTSASSTPCATAGSRSCPPSPASTAPKCCSPMALASRRTPSSLAVGYRGALEPLVGHLGVLGEKGWPLVTGARTVDGAPGMWFTGFSNPISGVLRELGIDARRIAKAVPASSVRVPS